MTCAARDSSQTLRVTPNRLATEASPYLRSAAHQPVDWFPWGDEAFAHAAAEGKPILLDIGAVWCHWCHVIDRESYDDPAIAAIINDLYVAIKVDRDERPDVDRRYQEAVGAITGQGGWPLTGFLTPEGRVFYGGTYFPPEDTRGRPGFASVLRQIAQFWQTRRDAAIEQADRLVTTIREQAGASVPGRINETMTGEVVRQCTRMFDERYGGFGSQPKFPHPTAHELLINRLFETGDPTLRQLVTTTLTRMAQGGVYDQIGDGFHRYSVDAKWIVPHFEKMSYDNSELLRNYVDAWQVTNDESYRAVAAGIIRWTNEVLSDQERGGFYASQDADIDLDDDGDYFTWTVDEAQAVLDADELRVLRMHYDIHEHGEMHHNPAKNVLHCAIELPAVAKLLAGDEAEVRALLASGKRKLAEARRQRPTPFIDTTLYTNWNAMYVSAYLRAATAFGPGEASEALRTFAVKTLDRFLAEAWSEEHGFAHTHNSQLGPHNSLTDDQLQMTLALLDAYEATGEARYFAHARRTLDLTLATLWDAEHGGFFDCPPRAEALGLLSTPNKPLQDSPTPGLNGVGALALARMHALTGDDGYRARCEQLLNAFAEPALRHGFFAASYFLALEWWIKGPVQVVIVGDPGHQRTQQLLATAKHTFRPRKLVRCFTPDELTEPSLPPAVRSMLHAYDKSAGAVAFVCAGESCANPTSDANQLAELVGSFRKSEPQV